MKFGLGNSTRLLHWVLLFHMLYTVECSCPLGDNIVTVLCHISWLLIIEVFYHKASACVHALYMPNNGKVLMLIFGFVKVIGAKVPCANVHILYMVLGLQPSGFKRPIGFGQVCPFGTGQGAHLGHVCPANCLPVCPGQVGIRCTFYIY